MNDSVRAANSGSCPTDQAPAGLVAPRGDPGREDLEVMVERIEHAADLGWADTTELNRAIHNYAPEPKVIQEPDYLRSLDAALGLVPEGADWRRFTNRSCSIYAASPYNAKAQVRHDGYGPTAAAQLCAAIFKMHLAKAKQMEPSNGN